MLILYDLILILMYAEGTETNTHTGSLDQHAELKKRRLHFENCDAFSSFQQNQKSHL